MAASLISLLVVAAQAGFTSTAFALAAFSAFATTAINASLSKKGRNEKSPIPVSVREPTAPHKVIYGTTRVGGTVVFIGSTDRVTTTGSGTRTEEDKFLHVLVAVAGHEINAFKQMYFGDELVWDDGTFQSNWGNAVKLVTHEGDQTTADTILLNGETISATVSQSAMSGWTADHKLQGIAYAHVRLTHSTDYFPTGVPQISFVIEGKKVYDPDTATTAFSNNPALCIRDYLTDTKHGLGEASANIDDTSFINIKDICDEDVALDGGGTQKRYTLDGMLDTSVSIKENLAQLLTSFNGELSYSGGKFYLTGGEYVTPTVTITESDIVGPLQVITKSSRRDLYNGVKGVFPAAENNYIDTDYPTATSSIYEAKDGEQILLDFSLPLTTNNIRAQRIAKQIMLQSRHQVVVTIPMNLVGMKFKAGDTFYLTNTRLGYSSKPFKVQGWDLEFDNEGGIVVNVTARETGAVLHPETADTTLTDIYQWQTSDEQDFVVTGEIPVPDASTVSAPTNLTATQVTIVSPDGTVSSDLEVTWTESENSFVDRYELQYRRTNSVTASDGSTIAAETEPTSVFIFGTRHVLTGINDGEQYEIKLRALTPLGVQSDFDTATITAAGDVTAPSEPTVVAPSADHERVRLEVTAPTERDVMGIEVFNTTSSSTTPTGSSTPSFFIPASPGETVFYNHEKLTNGTTQYYFFRSIDYSDNASAWSSQYSATPLLRYAEGATVGAQVGINLTDENGADISTNFEILNNEIINDSGVDIGKIKDNLVITESIAANAVTANKILVDDLAAINADIGDITAGTLKGGSVPDANDVPSGSETGAFLNLSDGKFVFGDADHNILFDGTDLKINGDIITDLGGSGNNHIVFDGDTMDITGTLSSDDFVSGYGLKANHGVKTRLTSGTLTAANWDLRDSSGTSLTLNSLGSVSVGDFLHLGDYISESLIDGSTRFRLEWASDYYLEFSLINYSSTSDWKRAEISVITERSSYKSFTAAGVSVTTASLKRFGFDQDDSIGWTLKNSGDVEAQAITAKEINQVRLGSHVANNLVLGDSNTLSAITTGVDNIAIGPNAAPAITTEDGNVALGADSVVAAATDNATAIGTQADVSADRAIALGYNATASGTDSIAIGANVTASSNDQIKIGSTQTAVTIGSYDLSNFLTTSTTFGGDVSGTYDAIVVANDSHTHDTRYYTETEADNRFVNVTGDTMSGDLVISKADAKARFYDSTGTSGNNPFIEFDTTANQGIALELNVYDGELPVAGYGLVVGPSTTNSQFPSTGTLTFNVLGEIYAGGTALGSLNKVFHDGYHPNADKWTTARTLSLTGDVTGSVSWDGSGNASMTTTVAGAGDADTLDGLDSTQFLRSDADDTMTGDLRVDGAIGINTSALSTVANLHIHDSGDGTTLLRMTDGVTGTTAIDGLVMGLDGDQNGYLINSESSALRFGTSNTERARLDSLGSFMVGTTTANQSGITLNASDYIYVKRNDNALFLDRTSTDGSIAEFRKDGAAVGNIGATYGDLFIGTGNTALRFTDSLEDIRPVNSSGNNIDATTDLGASNSRFKDLHLSGSVNLGSTIVFEGSTADANETTLAVTNPTLDRTITLPDQSGTAMLWQSSWQDDLGTNNLAIGQNALSSHNSGAQYNLAIGNQALQTLTAGDYNIGIGYDALGDVSTATNNIGIGPFALNVLSTGNYNTSVGVSSSDTTTGSYNTHIGYFGGPDGFQGNNSYQTSVGASCFALGDYSISIGYKVGDYHTGNYGDSSTSIFIGAFSARRVTGADRNVCVGTSIMASNTSNPTADDNTIMGHEAGFQILSGGSNVIIGSLAAREATSANNNTFVGIQAGRQTTTGTYHTFVGAYSGYAADSSANYTGSDLIAIGSYSKPSSYTASNEITLGNTGITTLRCNVTTISSLSDERDKTDIADIGLGLDFIKAMRPVEFTWDRRDGTRNGVTDIGFIAQELAEVEYQFSSGSRTRLVQIHPDKFEADPMRTYPIMVKAMQEMAAKIEQLEARISQLEGA